MQDLRDKLLKAGLASKKDARAARTEKRKARKKRGGARAAAREQQDKKDQFERDRAHQARLDRERQDRLNQDRAARERGDRIQSLIASRALPRPPAQSQDRAFYFSGRDGRIRRTLINRDLATKLSDGALAIVDLRGDATWDHALVDAATATRLEELGASDWILFWNPDQTELPRHGSGA